MGSVVGGDRRWNDGYDMFLKAKFFEMLPNKMKEIDIHRVYARIGGVNSEHSHNHDRETR
jgi:hypothetical protein